MKHVVFWLWSFAFLYPVLVTPVVADDFAGPFYQFSTGGDSFFSSLRYGFDNATGGVNFRVIGMPIGSLFHYLHIYLAGKFSVPIIVSYAAVKFLILVACSYGVSLVVNEVLSLRGHEISRTKLRFIGGLIFFGTLHIHGNWSNDPVASYPYAGYGSVVLMLMIFLYSIRLYQQVNLKHSTILSLLTVVSVFYYEITLAAIVGVAPLLLHGSTRTLRLSEANLSTKIKKISYQLLPLILPSISVLIGRFLIAQTSVNYEGTTVSVAGNFVKTFFFSLVGNLPGSAWALSFELVPRTRDIAQWLLPIFLVLVFTALWLGRNRDAFYQRASVDSLGFWFLIIGCALTVLSAVAMQSLTVKIQNETPRIGYVYTHYAIGSTFIAVLLLLLFYQLPLKKIFYKAKKTLIFPLLLFLAVQWNINWRLSEHMNSTLVPNRVLLSTFSNSADVNIRCAALNNWTAGGWPDYYEIGMVDGLQKAYKVFRKEEFCPNFARPFP